MTFFCHFDTFLLIGRSSLRRLGRRVSVCAVSGGSASEMTAVEIGAGRTFLSLCACVLQHFAYCWGSTWGVGGVLVYVVTVHA